MLEEQGKLEEAIAEFRSALKTAPNNAAVLTALGHAQALAGKKSDAEKVIARLQELSKQQYVSPFQAAAIYAALGDSTKAFELLEKSRQERFN